jgi:hypothetical protein
MQHKVLKYILDIEAVTEEIHSFKLSIDSVDDELIWAIIQKDIPVLSEEMQRLKSSF